MRDTSKSQASAARWPITPIAPLSSSHLYKVGGTIEDSNIATDSYRDWLGSQVGRSKVDQRWSPLLKMHRVSRSCRFALIVKMLVFEHLHDLNTVNPQVNLTVHQPERSTKLTTKPTEDDTVTTTRRRGRVNKPMLCIYKWCYDVCTVMLYDGWWRW